MASRILGSKSSSLAVFNNLWRFSYSSVAVAAAKPAENVALKDYADYRRSLYGQITHKALLVDAVGTLVLPSQPMAEVHSLSLSLSKPTSRFHQLLQRNMLS